MQELSRNFSNTEFHSLFDWAPDLERFARELKEAEDAGIRDDLCLVEMECSIDLIDAELLGARSSQARAPAKLQQLRGQLASLIARMKRLPVERERRSRHDRGIAR